MRVMLLVVWLLALPLSALAGGVDDFHPPPRHRVNNDEICLRKVIYHEIRGGTDKGRTAVGEVVMNRLASGKHGNTVCDVVYEKRVVVVKKAVHGSKAKVRVVCQFSWVCRKPEPTVDEEDSWERTGPLARKLLGQQRPKFTVLPRNAVHFHNRTVHPSWASDMKRVANIDSHLFYVPRKQ